MTLQRQCHLRIARASQRRLDDANEGFTALMFAVTVRAQQATGAMAHSMAKIDDTRPFIPVRIAILTMSDTRVLADDKSGNTLAEMITQAGHTVADRALVKDDVNAIRDQVRAWIAAPDIDVVITTGGTGFTGRDVTPEAVRPLFEKEIEGFSVVFHMISFQKIETSTIQSRACGGVAHGTYIFCLPGSPGACKDAWHGILKWQFDNRHRPCNFVEIMPRLEEHRRPG